MRFQFKKIQGQEPVNIACHTGYAAAARVEFPAAGKPCLTLAAVEALPGLPDAQLDEICRILGLRRANLRLLLDPTEYQFIQAELPVVEANELKVALKWQIKDLLRQPVDQSALEVIAIPNDSPAGRRPMGYAVTAPTAVVLDRMLRVRNTRSYLSVIDIPESAQCNIATLLEESGRGTALLSITRNGCLYTVSRNGALYFTRNFEVSIPALDASAEARRALFDRLVLELQRSMDVLDRQFSFLSVSALWLAPFEHRDELQSLLIETLDLPVKTVQIEHLFDCAEDVLPASLDAHAALIHPLGLALHQNMAPGQQINLVDPGLIPVKPVFPLASLVQAIAVIGLALFLLIWFAGAQLKQLEREAKLSQQRVNATQLRLKAALEKAATRQPDPQLDIKLQITEQEAKALQQVATLLQSGGAAASARGWSSHLYGLAEQTISGVWLTGITLQDKRVDLQGMSLQADLIPVYLNSLKQVPALQGQAFDIFEMKRSRPLQEGEAGPVALDFRLHSREPRKSVDSPKVEGAPQ